MRPALAQHADRQPPKRSTYDPHPKGGTADVPPRSSALRLHEECAGPIVSLMLFVQATRAQERTRSLSAQVHEPPARTDAFQSVRLRLPPSADECTSTMVRRRGSRTCRGERRRRVYAWKVSATRARGTRTTPLPEEYHVAGESTVLREGRIPAGQWSRTGRAIPGVSLCTGKHDEKSLVDMGSFMAHKSAGL